MKDYFYQLWISIDQLANTLLGGYADETLSSRAYRLYLRGSIQCPYYVINALFWWQNNHCRGAYNADKKRHQVLPEDRAKGADK